MSYRLYFNETLDDGLPRIAAEQVDRAIAELGGNGTDLAGAVHQVRKRCKKIRGLLRLFRGSLPAAYSQENAWFRDLARSLSSARDAQAMLECLDSLCAAFSQDLETDAFASVRHALEARRAATQHDADLPQRVQDTAAKLQDARGRVLGWRPDQGGFPAVEPGLSRTYRRARKALHASYRKPTPEQFHEWRKRVKYHWYHLRLLRELWPAPMKALAAESKQLADILGDDHDLAVLQETLLQEHDALGEQDEIDALVALAERRQGQLRAQAQTLGWRLFAEKPKVFCRRLHACWHATTCEATRSAGLAGETGARC
jgi:CHAD domain-containing protein